MAIPDARCQLWLAYMNGPYERYITILGLYSHEETARQACSEAKKSKEYRPESHVLGIRSVMLDVDGDSQVI